MTLAEVVLLLEGALGPSVTGQGFTESAGDPDVSGIVHDSTQVTPGAVFVALRGQRVDGASFAGAAARAGAVCIISDGEVDPTVKVPWVRVPDARHALAVLAAEFCSHPSREMAVVGITGTNGKTTTAYLVQAIFESAGVRCGRLGTISHQVGTDERSASLTTPEATDIQRYLREMVDGGTAACAMEVSSHALALERVAQVRFATAVFTNLTRDHLDFHGDMNRYFEAKRRLFEMLPSGRPAIVNLDDPRGGVLVEIVERPVTYAIRVKADVTSGPVDASLRGLQFDVRSPRGSLRVRSALIGRVNVYNILAAISAGIALDLPFSAIEAGVADVAAVPGRFETVSSRSDDVTVIVDFAHTDDALRSLLEAARPLAKGRLITLFGCGGDRDRSKRPLMGVVAARLSDLVIVTSDNPRSEDPDGIIAEVVSGIEPRGDRPDPSAAANRVDDRRTAFRTLVDRAEAIEYAVQHARAEDVVILAGRGHETSQAIGQDTVTFDDAVVARAALARRRSRSHVS